MTEDELSVRLEWGERSTVPFRPSTDETSGAPAPREDSAVEDRLVHLERSVGELQEELTRLRAELDRLGPASAPSRRGVPSDATASRRGAQSTDRPRPIRVRAKPRSSDPG